MDSQELTDRVFGKSIWSTARTANRSYKLVVSGVKTINDTGLTYIRQAATLNALIYFNIWVEHNSIIPIEGLAYVKTLTENILIDKNIEISFELLISKLGKIDTFSFYAIASEELDLIVSEDNSFLIGA